MKKMQSQFERKLKKLNNTRSWPTDMQLYSSEVKRLKGHGYICSLTKENSDHLHTYSVKKAGEE